MVIAIALSLLLTLPGQAEGLVLCLSHDGGMAIELGCEGVACCGAVHEDVGQAQDFLVPQDADECSCTDIPLGTGVQVQAAGLRCAPEQVAPAVHAAALTHQPQVDLRNASAARALAPPIAASTPVALSIRMLL
jgi:hypothetical protein